MEMWVKYKRANFVGFLHFLNWFCAIFGKFVPLVSNMVIVFHLAWCTLSLKIWEKQLGNMVIVFYIKHGVQRDQPPVKIGKTPQQFTCAYMETYTQFDAWTELQREKALWPLTGLREWELRLEQNICLTLRINRSLSQADLCWHNYYIQSILVWHRSNGNYDVHEVKKMEFTMIVMAMILWRSQLAGTRADPTYHRINTAWRLPYLDQRAGWER